MCRLIFHNPDLWPLTAGSAEGVVVPDRMADAFIAFAKTGTPGTRELPWPAIDRIRPTMIFDVQSGAKNDPDRDLLALLPPGGRGRGR